ncbi:hypothetical protein GCG54_00014953 [Colletotrichum gloeosporioides]|uniref:Hemerythrin HHE cation binding domain-containing protein n=2 Tax=Colletotrichum gloeosporioides TaxID=474922 RepID=T0KH57_COLGC|nr:uncharacterized protein GCG54_00014953 [Colletotrichum gloeosporioides]EQB51459.1 hemerythrin HHE cation binding domain-containing protein [Colletotrichum gloeosporioides Cg-14]KAF3801737.1 hypothetical protein GCG54_00014953 [Colletotrichum gloeosporioides]
MAPIYADHPFSLVSTPISQLPKDVKLTMFHRIASEMALVHNCILRGLNAIYLQAPHIKPEDVFSFANYMHQWYRMIHAHHSGEERLFFPAVERLTGIVGFMDVNIEQHKSFHNGLESFAQYIKALIAREVAYDGDKVVSLIDRFGKDMCLHLEEEIPTILSLEKFGTEKMAPVEKIFAQEAQEVMQEMGFLDGLPWALTTMDSAFEGGLWADVPPDPVGKLILKIVRYVTWWLHRDWWKFGACDGNGNMQPLYALRDGKQ